MKPVVVLLATAPLACSDGEKPPDKKPVEPKASVTTCLPAVAPTLTSQVPSDSPVADQPSLNCFAWQEFIALNWPAAPKGGGVASPEGPRSFGRPGARDPVVWESFMDAHELMTPDGSAPPPWGTPPTVPDACKKLGKAAGVRALRHSSKFTADLEVPGDLAEAAPFDAPNWLADRDGNPVMYEILVNQDEYQYIVDSGFYNATAQQDSLKSGTHVNVPRGVIGGATGSIEIKAAWLVVTDPKEPRWKTYKLADALVWDGEDQCQEQTVALVGLHIIHKTTSNPQWTWATFEHVDNAPDQAAVASGKMEDRYRFYSPSCTERDVDPACAVQVVPGCTQREEPPAKTSCAPNEAPAYCLDLSNPACPPYPIQVTRTYPIADNGDNQVATLNKEMRELIRQQAGPDSVWQHYQLVGVLWSGAPVDENLPGSSPPTGSLAVSGIRPDTVAQPLANTTLETYAQTTTCVGCHRSAQIAGAGDDGVAEYNSDYSFVFQKANAPGDQ